MFQSIPASKIVSVNPAVLSSGGSPLSMNAVFLSKNENLPTGRHTAFPDALAVGEFFGLTSEEFKAAQVYFKGFDNSHIKPGTLYFYPYNVGKEAAYLRGASVKSMSLAALKKLSGNLKVNIDGNDKSGDNISLAAATSFSDAADKIGTAISATVQFDEQLQAFEIVSATQGRSSEIGFATGTLAEALNLTEAKGAVLSKGNDGDSAETVMEGVIQSTLNFATFTTVFEPELADKLALAKWSNAQNNRFLYAAWGKEAAALQTGNTTCLGAQLKAAAYDGTAPIYGGLDKAAFLCGAIASIDFTETQGRITLAFKNQSGLSVDVDNAADADNLKENGYNYYGAWATANDRFTFLYTEYISLVDANTHNPNSGNNTGKWAIHAGKGLKASTTQAGIVQLLSATNSDREDVAATPKAVKIAYDKAEEAARLAVPSGAVLYFAGKAAPSGWLKANGAAVSRSTYAALFAAIGTTYGTGDGRSTFNLPDLRGEFVRGWDDGRGVDNGRALGSAQADEFKAHTHGGVPQRAGDRDRGGEASWFSIDGIGQTEAAGGSETRPRNIALLACIKI